MKDDMRLLLRLQTKIDELITKLVELDKRLTNLENERQRERKVEEARFPRMDGEMMRFVPVLRTR